MGEAGESSEGMVPVGGVVVDMAGIGCVTKCKD